MDLKRKMTEKMRCDNCGCFIAYKDLENGEATHSMTLPDSDYSYETWESTCKKCLKAEKEYSRIKEMTNEEG